MRPLASTPCSSLWSLVMSRCEDTFQAVPHSPSASRLEPLPDRPLPSAAGAASDGSHADALSSGRRPVQSVAVAGSRNSPASYGTPSAVLPRSSPLPARPLTLSARQAWEALERAACPCSRVVAQDAAADGAHRRGSTIASPCRVHQSSRSSGSEWAAGRRPANDRRRRRCWWLGGAFFGGPPRGRLG